MNNSITIQRAERTNNKSIWKIFKQILKRGDSLHFPSKTTFTEFNLIWFNKNSNAYVAISDGQIVGSYVIVPNHTGRASHVANAIYMVDVNFRGKSIGKLLGKHSLTVAKELAYKAMQFNLVVSTNVPAVKLWKNLGFDIIGEVPKAFEHPVKGFVSAYIMHRNL